MNENNLVVKSNKLIESKGRMSLMEQKFIIGIISQISICDTDFQKYKIDLSDFKNKVGSSSNRFYEQIEKAANTLMDKKIKIEKDEKVLLTRYLSSVSYLKGTSEIEVSFSPELKPYLLQLAGEYTQYQLKHILELKSSYAIRIYEIIKQWEKVKKKVFAINTLRELLGINNEEYGRFSDFERKVLKVAKNEINEKTDLWIDYKKIKEGRKITKIKFTIEPKFIDEEQELLEAFTSPQEMETIRTKSGFADEKFSDKQVMQLYEIACEISGKFNIDIDPYIYIKLNFEYMLKQKGVNNRFAYLKKALEEDFAGAVVKIVMNK